MGSKRTKNNDYPGQKMVRYILLPVAACLTIILSISFLLHLFGEDSRISSSESAQQTQETLDLSKQTESALTELTEATETTNGSDNTEVSDVVVTDDSSSPLASQPQSAEQISSSNYKYLPQTDLELYDGIADPRTVKTLETIDPYSLVALVNKGFILPADFEPAELVPASGFSWFQLHPDANEAWADLRQACQQETGIELYLTSAYRSYDVQNMLFKSALQRKGIALSVGYNAYQGRSEHQLGLAIDITDSNTSKNSTTFAQTDAYDWMMENADRFGFISRYPAHKVYITDYCYEPWHFRYVGVDLAEHLTEYDLTLEEYYGLGPLTDHIADPDTSN